MHGTARSAQRSCLALAFKQLHAPVHALGRARYVHACLCALMSECVPPVHSRSLCGCSLVLMCLHSPLPFEPLCMCACKCSEYIHGAMVSWACVRVRAFTLDVFPFMHSLVWLYAAAVFTK